jgi:hypothetical protein
VEAALISTRLQPGESVVPEQSRFNGFARAVSYPSKPLKRFATRHRDHTRLKPGANEMPALPA